MCLCLLAEGREGAPPPPAGSDPMRQQPPYTSPGEYANGVEASRHKVVPKRERQGGEVNRSEGRLIGVRGG